MIVLSLPIVGLLSEFIKLLVQQSVADPDESLTGDLHSNFGRGRCGGRGQYESRIYAMTLLSKAQ